MSATAADGFFNEIPSAFGGGAAASFGEA